VKLPSGGNWWNPHGVMVCIGVGPNLHKSDMMSQASVLCRHYAQADKTNTHEEDGCKLEDFSEEFHSIVSPVLAERYGFVRVGVVRAAPFENLIAVGCSSAVERRLRAMRLALAVTVCANREKHQQDRRHDSPAFWDLVDTATNLMCQAGISNPSFC